MESAEQWLGGLGESVGFIPILGSVRDPSPALGSIPVSSHIWRMSLFFEEGLLWTKGQENQAGLQSSFLRERSTESQAGRRPVHITNGVGFTSYDRIAPLCLLLSMPASALGETSHSEGQGKARGRRQNTWVCSFISLFYVPGVGRSLIVLALSCFV